MKKTDLAETCVNCGRTEAEIPVLSFLFNSQEHGICSGCLPTLLHRPSQLEGKLPGAEKLSPVSHNHD
jgi:hypothetical protein